MSWWVLGESQDPTALHLPVLCSPPSLCWQCNELGGSSQTPRAGGRDWASTASQPQVSARQHPTFSQPGGGSLCWGAQRQAEEEASPPETESSTSWGGGGEGNRGPGWCFPRPCSSHLLPQSWVDGPGLLGVEYELTVPGITQQKGAAVSARRSCSNFVLKVSD